MRLLLLSNSTMPGTPFFSWPSRFVRQFLGDERRKIIFIPYAAVTLTFDHYSSTVGEVFDKLGYDLTSIHQQDDPKRAIHEAHAIVVGGGNTFVLLTRLYEANLLELIHEKVMSGAPYIGWSAGANLACPTIMTTNDMPVIQPPSFEALNLVPFQINPHYTEFKQAGHGGESRMDRIKEFITLNPSKIVTGLPEGMLIERNGNRLSLMGTGVAKLFQAKKEVAELLPGDISNLLA